MRLLQALLGQVRAARLFVTRNALKEMIDRLAVALVKPGALCCVTLAREKPTDPLHSPVYPQVMPCIELFVLSLGIYRCSCFVITTAQGSLRGPSAILIETDGSLNRCELTSPHGVRYISVMDAKALAAEAGRKKVRTSASYTTANSMPCTASKENKLALCDSYGEAYTHVNMWLPFNTVATVHIRDLF